MSSPGSSFSSSACSWRPRAAWPYVNCNTAGSGACWSCLSAQDRVWMPATACLQHGCKLAGSRHHGQVASTCATLVRSRESMQFVRSAPFCSRTCGTCTGMPLSAAPSSEQSRCDHVLHDPHASGFQRIRQLQAGPYRDCWVHHRDQLTDRWQRC